MNNENTPKDSKEVLKIKNSTKPIEEIMEEQIEWEEGFDEGFDDYEKEDGAYVKTDFDEEMSDEIGVPKIRKKRESKAKINVTYVENKPMHVIFMGYFNMLAQDLIDDTEIEYLGCTGDTPLTKQLNKNNVTLNAYKYHFVFKYKGVLSSLTLNKYKDSRGYNHEITITTIESVEFSDISMYQTLKNEAIGNSELKGNHITFKDEHTFWTVDMNKPKVTFDDVHLPEPVMDKLKFFCDIYMNKGILLRHLYSGVPGSGKTESVRACSWLLNQTGVTIIKTNVCKQFAYKVNMAKILAPSIIILDDIDLYLGNRNNTGFSGALGRFLDILDGVNKLPENVGILATTNAPHLVDLAAQRPGRFHEIVFFDELTIENIRNIIIKSLTKLGIEKHTTITQEELDLFTNDSLVDYFKTANSTGSEIYESVRNLKHNYDLYKGELDMDTVIRNLKSTKETLKNKLTRTSSIDIDFGGNYSGGDMGFR